MSGAVTWGDPVRWSLGLGGPTADALRIPSAALLGGHVAVSPCGEVRAEAGLSWVPCEHTCTALPGHRCGPLTAISHMLPTPAGGTQASP